MHVASHVTSKQGKPTVRRAEIQPPIPARPCCCITNTSALPLLPLLLLPCQRLLALQ